MKPVVLTMILLALLVSACGGKETPEPTPDIDATVQAAVRATLTAWPTATAVPAPTRAPTDTPTEGSAATPTETSAPTEAPMPTVPPGPTNTPAPTATQGPEPTPTPTPLVHVIQPGETLSGIAIEYGVSLEALQAANDIEDARQVRSGTELVIPFEDEPEGEGEPSEATTPPSTDEASGPSDNQPEPAGTSAPAPAAVALEDLPDPNKAMVIETALRLDEAVVVKGVTILREPDRETILVVIETRGGTGSMGDQTTLREAATSFVYSQAADQRLDIGADFVLVQAQNGAGQDSWYAAAAMGDIGLLTASEITLAEFLQRVRIETPS